MSGCPLFPRSTAHFSVRTVMYPKAKFKAKHLDSYESGKICTKV